MDKMTIQMDYVDGRCPECKKEIRLYYETGGPKSWVIRFEVLGCLAWLLKDGTITNIESNKIGSLVIPTDIKTFDSIEAANVYANQKLSHIEIPELRSQMKVVSVMPIYENKFIKYVAVAS